MPDNSFETIFFDAGNTLVQFDFCLFENTLKSLGIHYDRVRFEAAHWEAQKALGAWAKTIDSHEARCRKANRVWFEKGGVPENRVEEALNLLSDHPERHRFWSALPKETIPALKELKKRGYRLAVVSNAEGTIEEIMINLGLRPFFETVVDSHLVGFDKPDPKIFEIALERVKGTAAKTIHVGDLYEVDVVGARRAGITPVLFDPNGMYPEVDDCRKISSLLDLVRGALF